MTGSYIHHDGTGCHHGIDPAELDTLDAAQDDADRDPDTVLPRPRVRCRAGQLVAGFRLDPDQPVPP